jgi:hypothetical protein
MNAGSTDDPKRLVRKPAWGRLLVCAGFLGLMPLGGLGGGAASAGRGTSFQVEGNKPGGKLSYRLQMLAQPTVASESAQGQAEALSLPAEGPGSLLKNAAGQVLVHIRLSKLSSGNLADLEKAGAKIVDVANAYRVVTAFVNVDHLNALGDLAAVKSVREVLAPETTGPGIPDRSAAGIAQTDITPQVGCGTATTSEGDTQLHADAARSAHGVDGSGLEVGILSDSYDNYSGTPVTDASDDIISGDLPGASNPCGHTTPIDVIQEGPAGADEGRAMLQIIHDLAPGADLAFASAFLGEFNFANQILALRAAGADVISDDIYYYDEPFFQDGPVAQAITEVTGDGALYFTSAGNAHYILGGQAIASYEATAYRPMACPIVLTDGDCHDFNPGAGTDNTYRFALVNGGVLLIDFQWAEPWYGVQTDLDIFLLDGSNNLLAASYYDNPGFTDTPFEAFSYTNTSGSTQNVYLVINRYSGTATPRIKYILTQSTFALSSVEYNASNSTDTFGPTVWGHAGSDDAISMAAVPYDDSNTPEDFSSRGYPTYYFGPVIGTTPAAALPSPETRYKPDVGATDGGRNTFFGYLDGAHYRFYGTSAASPHGAAVATLMEQLANIMGLPMNQAFAESVLEDTASAMASGSAQANGSGLINALAALDYIGDFQMLYLPLIMR